MARKRISYFRPWQRRAVADRGSIAKMLSQHEQGRQLTARLRPAVTGFTAGDQPVAAGRLSGAIKPLPEDRSRS